MSHVSHKSVLHQSDETDGLPVEKRPGNLSDSAASWVPGQPRLSLLPTSDKNNAVACTGVLPHYLTDGIYWPFGFGGMKGGT